MEKMKAWREKGVEKRIYAIMTSKDLTEKKIKTFNEPKTKKRKKEKKNPWII